MKKAILLFAVLSMTIQLFSQEIIKDKTYYQAKSKRQKSAAFALLIGGGVAIGVGMLIGNTSESTFDDAATGVIIGGVGVLAMFGSIPLFLASGKNKRKAGLMVKMTPSPQNLLTGKFNRQFNAGVVFRL